MCPPCKTAENTFYRVSIKSCEFRESSGRGGKKLVALNAGGDAAAPLLIVDAQDSRVATNMNIACKRDLLRQGQDKLDCAAGLHNRFHHEIKTAEAYIARFALFFEDAGFRRKANLHRQRHR